MTGNPLTVAADTIRQYGWIQRQPGDVEVGFCLLGALGHVGRPAGLQFRALRSLQDVCEDVYGDALISYVNDRRITSADQAIQLLEKAAARYDEVVA